ncbi:hypothetical protein [Rhodococcus sp. I2R]|uniref:hypothetical protein n=1 Tax=Rhodococcus sp. I2R TaxID=2855445 RepID=UPI001E520A1B|nr:hypothetical protein [Rhodococcus sp. I2R]MCC8927287.1 hypothetical protein [Rhodococcus sp. I2R]
MYSTSRRLIRRLTAGVTAASTAVLLTACGTDVPEPTTPCGMITDLSESARAVTDSARAVVTSFATEEGCASIQVIPITSNSSGEQCSATPVSLTNLTAARDNPDGIAAEVEDVKIPELFGRIRGLADCIATAGTGGASDITGAFRQLDRILGAGQTPTVLVVSDLMHNIDVALESAPQDTPEERTALAAAIAEQLPDLSGWELISVGGAAGTTGIGAKRSDTVQRVWEEAVTTRGGTWTQAAM